MCMCTLNKKGGSRGLLQQVPGMELGTAVRHCVCVTDSSTCLSISFIPSTSSVDPTSSSVSLIPTCLLLFCTIYFYFIFLFIYYHLPIFLLFLVPVFFSFLFLVETFGRLLELRLSIKFSFLL